MPQQILRAPVDGVDARQRQEAQMAQMATIRAWDAASSGPHALASPERLGELRDQPAYGDGGAMGGDGPGRWAVVDRQRRAQEILSTARMTGCVK
jgi:hypothetical protein